MALEQRSLTPGRVRVARALAIATDFAQIVLFPAFAAGAASPWEDALDLLVATTLVWLVGWHWAFLPSFIAELVPGLDLVPTWTAAVFFATRGQTRPTSAEPPVRDVIDAEVVSSTRSPNSPD